MTKGLGATTSFGALLLAGFLFQGKSTSSPNLANHRTTGSQIRPLTGDGPWLASCKYWAPARSAESPDEKSSDLDLTLHITGEDLDSHIKKAPSPESSCGRNDDGWGIPKIDPHDPEHEPEVSAIIATVPDPIHSHLALDFDRSIDAILLAAADNHYLTSDYWLPWRSHVDSSTPGESVSTATSSSNDADSSRERQPGLIILRYAPDDSEWKDTETAKDGPRHNSAWSNYHRVIYLFLVAETPSLGVNGDQLQHAFQYEKILKEKHGATLSIRAHSQSDNGSDATHNLIPQCIHNHIDKPPNRRPSVVSLSVIGPFYSGSASSLHEGIETAKRDLPCDDEIVRPSISGVTSTKVGARELDPNNEHIYRSFGENVAFEQKTFLQSLAATGYDLGRVAILSEAGTVFGKSAASLPPELSQKGTVLQLSFPRELSLLRNAESTQSTNPDSTTPPTPYLNLSLKDYTADDTVPRFSTNQSPLSVEAQLMAIAHQLQRNRSQFILISASNVLDDIFLTGFLHRACPDARIVLINGGDLLFERDVDNAPYIGSISISPYLLTSLDFGNHLQWLHSSSPAEAIYNAASYTFWDGTADSPPTLAGYRRYPVPNPKLPAPDIPQFMQIPLWATVIGADGYYPLGILSWCASDVDAMLPIIHLSSPLQPGLECSPDAIFSKFEDQHGWDYVPESISRNSGISPSLLWEIITAFISLGCIGHCILLLSADFWSPSTRDLAIDHNDLPYRRAVHLNIGTTVLVSMAFVTAYPMLLVRHFYHIAAAGFILSILALVAAALALIVTFLKTWRYCYPRKRRLYLFFNLVSIVALIGTIWSWVAICTSNNRGGDHTYAGLFFSYRCLQPLSGVCPLLPVLLLLLAWYLWAICQTARLRFSDIHRPRIARILRAAKTSDSETPYPLFVPDNALERCSRPTDSCLYENITCLLISREVVCRLCTNLKRDPNKLIRGSAAYFQKHIDLVLGCIYVILFVLCIFASHIRALDRFFFIPIFSPIFAQLGALLHIHMQDVMHAFNSVARQLNINVPKTLTDVVTWSHTHVGPNRYEFLITALFFPLIMVALSGWLRVILIWGALSRGMLEPLERSPIRFAFSRFKSGSWMSMLRQKGLHIRWRDMARSTESIRQICHHKGLDEFPQVKQLLSQQYQVLISRLRVLMESLQTTGTSSTVADISTPALPAEALEGIDEPILSQEPFPSDRLWDLPKASADLRSIFYIEQAYAEFCRILLSGILVPHWDKGRTGLVEECSTPEGSAKPEDQKPTEPTFLHLAEELIVVRYVALIRSVLINIRYLMLFVSAAFVFAIIAWNSYPFQPHAFIDWCFTILLVMLGLGFVWVFAQMHRNAILSRLTDTKPNELGWEFYLRIVTFGAIPVLTWLAYQFPQIGGGLYKILQPGLQVVK